MTREQLIQDRQLLIHELQRFVDYYKKDGRITYLGNGEAQQHWTRSCKLLERLEQQS